MDKTITAFPMTPEAATAYQRHFAETHKLSLQDFLPLNEGAPIGLTLIPAGEFLMGTHEDAPSYCQWQGPQHRVLFSRPFYLSRCVVTQAQWRAVRGTNPAYFCNQPDHPVESVSWEEIVIFCQRASEITGRTVRLPSEAEWEYACRAGSDTAYHFGDSPALLNQHAWFRDNSDSITHPVGQRRPNAWGLYDLHGGVDEFVQDNWNESHVDAPSDGTARTESGDNNRRILKGGSWYDIAENCETSHRNNYDKSEPSEDHGFRIVVEIPLA